jgi:TolA-binding protein
MPPPRPAIVLAAGLVALLPPTLAAQDETWRLGLGLLQRGLHEEAAAQFEQFLAAAPRDPRAPEARYRLGVCRLELGAREAAIRAFEAALKDRAFALRPECLYRLAGAEAAEGRRAEAVSRYQELLDAVGDEHYLAAAAHFGAGEALRDGGDEAGAAAHFLAAARRAAPADPAGYRFSGLYQAGFALLRGGAAADAATTFETLLGDFPTHEARGELLHLLGEARFRSGALPEAEAAWERAVEAGGDSVDDALSGLGWSRRQRGASAGAREAFERLCARFADSPLAGAARLEIGRIDLEAGDAAAALRAVEPLCAEGADPGTRRAALELRGLASLELGRAEDARRALVAAADGAAPADRPRLRYAIAACDAAAGRMEDALAGYRDAAKVEDAALRGDALYGEVLSLHALGRHEESAARARELAASSAHRLAPLAAYAVAENLFALGRHAEALAAFEALGAGHPLAADARARAAWCAWLGGDAGAAAPRFAALAEDPAQTDPVREESLSMAALAALQAGDPESALRQADTYRARHPRGAQLGRTERVAARVLQQRGELRAAAERLARASQAESGDGAAAVAIERADLLLQAGDFRGARREYAEHRGRDDATGARALEGLAWCAFELGDDELCLREAAAGAAHPAAGEIAAGLRELAVTVQHRREAWTEAVLAAEAYLEHHAGHRRADEVRYALGVAARRAGAADRARAVLEPLRGAPGIERPDLVAREFALACQELADGPAARAAFVDAAARSADPELADECRLRAAEIDLAGEARAEARQVLAGIEHPAHRGRARYLAAQSWLAEDRPDDALAGFEAVVGLGADEALHDEALFASGETAHRLERFELAAERLLAWLRRNPKPDADTARIAARARLLCGEALLGSGRPADAVPVLRPLVERRPAAAEPPVLARAWLALGRAEAARGAGPEAEQAFGAAVGLSDGAVAAEAQFRIGELRRAAGDLAGAADAFVRVSILYSHEPWVPRGLLEAGRAFDELGQADKAERLWRELVERHADSAEARQIAGRLRGGQR